jgi:hypothetical protein
VALSALDDRTHEPTLKELAAVLGRSAPHWDVLTQHLQDEYGPLAQEWHFAGDKYGWSLRLKKAKRTIIYLLPEKDAFLAALVFGERAVAAIRQSDLPADVKALVEAARPYAEGRGIRLEVRRRTDVDCVRKLAAIKMA